MKRLLFSVFLFLSFAASAQIQKVLPPKPNPPRLVNDFANLLTPEQEEALEQKLVAYDDSTSTQIVIVTVPSLQGYTANDYATQLGRSWGVGGKQFSNGIVILVSTEEGNREAYIATGYGMEGAIPDVTAKAIVDNDLIPNFKEGNFYRGFDTATDDIIKAAAGEYKAEPKKKKSRGVSFGTIIFLIILMLILFSGDGRNRGGGMMSRRGYGDFGTGWITGSMLSNLGRSGGGGGWSGGSGGGFGGFGGGGFGGGGAGGKW
ncbi:MAG: hypothetical protein C4308_00065 [Chitinophagaceae bacterium]